MQNTELIRMRLIVVFCSAFALCLTLVFVSENPKFASKIEEANLFDNYSALNRELSVCIDHSMNVTSTRSPKFLELQQFWWLCENQLYDQLLLNDFTIRRGKFQQNSMDERVNLWLVVVITISGVALSALQLMMSYRLAVNSKIDLAANSELIVEQGKLSVKSAYVGLLIMTLSLLFFGIYVKWIYLTIDVETSKPANLIAHPGNLLPEQGTIGWPEDWKSQGSQPTGDSQSERH